MSSRPAGPGRRGSARLLPFSALLECSIQLDGAVARPGQGVALGQHEEHRQSAGGERERLALHDQAEDAAERREVGVEPGRRGGGVERQHQRVGVEQRGRRPAQVRLGPVAGRETRPATACAGVVDEDDGAGGRLGRRRATCRTAGRRGDGATAASGGAPTLTARPSTVAELLEPALEQTLWRLPQGDEQARLAGAGRAEEDDAGAVGGERRRAWSLPGYGMGGFCCRGRGT